MPSALFEMPLGDRARAGLGDEPAEREVAERRPDSARRADRAASRSARSRGTRRRRCRSWRAARRAGAGTRPRRPARPSGSSASAAAARRCSASGRRSRGDQRFGGDQRRLQRVERRRAGLQDLVGARDRLVERAAAQREPRAEHAHRPFVPLAGLAAVGAVRLAGAAEEIARGVVAAADQVNLRQRVEHRAGGLVKLNRAAHLERAVQRVFGARRDRRAARRSARAWRARRRGRGPSRALRAATTLRSASASACS